MANAARISDLHQCPKQTPGTPPIPHIGGPIIGPGSSNVIIGGVPASVVGDNCFCVGEPSSITSGSSSVFINGKQASHLYLNYLIQNLLYININNRLYSLLFREFLKKIKPKKWTQRSPLKVSKN